jgi:hypothetical protein
MIENIFAKPPVYGTIVNIRRSSRMTDLGDLKNELRTRVGAILPAMFQRLGTEAFEPGKFEVEWSRMATVLSSPNIAIPSWRVRKSSFAGSSALSITFTGSRNRSRAVFCGSIPLPAAKNPTRLSTLSR